MAILFNGQFLFMATYLCRLLYVASIYDSFGHAKEDMYPKISLFWDFFMADMVSKQIRVHVTEVLL